MFDPEYQDIDCPSCLRRRVYADREIGFYCMSCGHLLSADEALMLIGQSVLPSRTMPKPGMGPRKLIVEIREMRPARRTPREEHARHETMEGEQAEQ